MTYVSLLLLDGQMLSLQGVMTAKYAAKEVAAALGDDTDRPWFLTYVDDSHSWTRVPDDAILAEFAEAAGEPLTVQALCVRTHG